jgi:outer membrane protein assembly factor BamD
VIDLPLSRRVLQLSVTIFALTAALCCRSSGRGTVPPGTTEPDRFLYERGMAALEDKSWLTARQFFTQVTETYTQSPFRPDAKLGIGDSYLGEGTAESMVLAINEFQEFLAFYPTHARADYAQYKLGMAHFNQMRAPQRDQSETRNAIRDLEAFLTRYPNSSLVPEVRGKLREARDRLSTSEYEVGLHYYRVKWYPGAADRFQTLLKQDPEYSRRDAVYFYLGETLIRGGRRAEALPYFERLLAEFDKSEFTADAHRRIDELKAQVEAKDPS